MNYSCRVCGNKLTERVILLADMPLTDDFVSASNPERNEYIRDIGIYQCGRCGIVQNPDNFNHESYYQDYQYTSSHSDYAKRFMEAYAAEVFDVFSSISGRTAESVLEIGSGDGQQLEQFLLLGVRQLKGVEPSTYLADIANKRGIDTCVNLFGGESLNYLSLGYDICLSSYTFDHVRNPVDYLATAHALLVEGGILALEIHYLQKIIDRTEYCLFEHEHTIYLTAEDVKYMLKKCGFSVILINPIPQHVVRGNSLIVIAKKVVGMMPNFQASYERHPCNLSALQARINSTVRRIDHWIRQLPDASRLIGFGAGGRGVMTMAALSEYARFDALFDSNYESGSLLAPKTRVPVVGPDSWHKYAGAYCIVFSFGYFDEIQEQLEHAGFLREQIVSLLDFYSLQGDEK